MLTRTVLPILCMDVGTQGQQHLNGARVSFLQWWAQVCVLFVQQNQHSSFAFRRNDTGLKRKKATTNLQAPAKAQMQSESATVKFGTTRNCYKIQRILEQLEISVVCLWLCRFIPLGRDCPHTATLLLQDSQLSLCSAFLRSPCQQFWPRGQKKKARGIPEHNPLCNFFLTISN